MNLLPLDQVRDPDRFGRKATTLGDLLRAQLPVPSGFALSADAPDSAIEDIAMHLATWAGASAPFGVAVRSSAAIEDGEHASYAGMFTSLFARPYGAAVASAIRAVRESARSANVRLYQQARGLDPADSRVAVIVQEAIRPVASGVLFTQWPPTPEPPTPGWRTEGPRIEATWGLSTLLLAGHTPPDVIVHQSGRADRTQVAGKFLTVLPATDAELAVPPGEWLDVFELGWRAKLAHSDPDEGLIYLQTPPDVAERACLPGPVVGRLVALAGCVVDVVGTDAVDIEWVHGHDGRLHLIQARPATTALVPAAVLPDPEDQRDQMYAGTPASPGQATGPAKAPAAGREPGGAFPAGHVLVTAPAGPEMMPALIACSAVISSDAGVLCHTAIVARELAKPCVVDLHEAPAAFTDATDLAVDGTAGTVTVVGHDSAVPGGLDGTPSPEPDYCPRDDPSTMPVLLAVPDIESADSAEIAHVVVADADLLNQLSVPLAAQALRRSIAGLLVPAGQHLPDGFATRRQPLRPYGDLVWTREPPTRFQLVARSPDGEELLRLPDHPQPANLNGEPIR